MFFRYLFDYFLDLIFPKHCIGCGKENIYLCGRCQRQIVLLRYATCPECKKITKFGQYCSRHRKQYLNGVIIACYYHKGVLREAIHSFKYNGLKELSMILGQLMVQRLVEIKPRGYQKWIIVPVPLHRKRAGERGYNQAELLAQIVAKNTGLKIVKDQLIRTKYTIPQVKLSDNDRQNNLIGAFDWKKENEELKRKIILLIDDVATTGSTLEECAKILKIKARAFRVYGLVLAKG